jgi:hypothetical protein
LPALPCASARGCPASAPDANRPTTGTGEPVAKKAAAAVTQVLCGANSFESSGRGRTGDVQLGKLIGSPSNTRAFSGVADFPPFGVPPRALICPGVLPPKLPPESICFTGGWRCGCSPARLTDAIVVTQPRTTWTRWVAPSSTRAIVAAFASTVPSSSTRDTPCAAPRGFSTRISYDAE